MAADTETVILEEGAVKVTNLRALINAKTYAMSNITSVEMTKRAASSCLPLMLIVGGGAWALIAISSLFSHFDFGLLIQVLVGGALAFGGIVLASSAKPIYAVKIGSASGESNILESTDQKMIARIVAAMNDAIVRRG